MKIEKVENGFIVEVEVELPEHVTASTVIRCGTEKHICHDLTDLLNFINAHYAEETGKMVVSKEVDSVFYQKE